MEKERKKLSMEDWESVKRGFYIVLDWYGKFFLVGLIIFNFYVFGVEVVAYSNGAEVFKLYATATAFTIVALVLYFNSMIRIKGR